MSVHRVSLNEVLRLARRVLLAWGAGPGCEHEPALAVTWLESRGLAGLEMLWRECRPPCAPARWAAEEGAGAAVATLRIDGGGGSAAWIAAAAADWLAAREGPARVQVSAARSPLWFVPELAARRERVPAWLLARGDDGGAAAPLLAARASAAGVTLELACDPAALAGREAALTLGRGASPPLAWTPRERIGHAALAARHAASLDGGIAVDEQLWHALYGVARGALVPESAASRARGAGAEGE